MRAALAASLVSSAAAVYQGFNYPSTNGDGSARVQSDFESDFSTAKALVGTDGGFTSARLYTMIQEGSTTDPISAIPAAISQDVSLLLGLWVSGGNIANEITALTNAISQYGSDFASHVAGISVGSEDLYRDSEVGIQAKAGVGAGPDVVLDAIKQVRSAISGTALSAVPVGHVDTWTAWVNSSIADVVDNVDFIGFDAYPYFQNTMSNSIDVASDLFYSALQQTEAAANGKPIWVTETGWPVTGPTENQAIASTQNAETYWQEIACNLLGKTNTWWYTLNDNGASPSFGVETSGTTPLYNLSCAANTTTSSSSSSSASATATSTSASGSASGSATGSATSISIPASLSPSISASAQGGGSPGVSALTSANSSAIATATGSLVTKSSTSASATASSFTGGAASNSGSIGALVGAVAVLFAAL